MFKLTLDAIANIRFMMSVIQPNVEDSFEIVILQKQEELDLFFFDRILSSSDSRFDHTLTLDQLRQMQSYPCYMVKKKTYGPNEAKAILFGNIGQTIGEFTLNSTLIKARKDAEVIAYLAA